MGKRKIKRVGNYRINIKKKVMNNTSITDSFEKHRITSLVHIIM